MLVVNHGEGDNSIVFAFKGDALDRFRVGAMRRPAQLEAAAADQLLGAFALISSAIKARAAA